MKCPVCQSIDLLMAERQGVEIDYCPQCRGVWLDRGELDKIIERTMQLDMQQMPQAAAPPPPQQPQMQAPQAYYQERHHDKHDDHDHDKHKHGYGEDQFRQKKRKSFLTEMFDF
jgi:uncharacterized protein